MSPNAIPIKKLYYSIGEVSKITELKQYVLRYWETEFKQLKPSKNRAGNRIYRQQDIDLILEIKDLLYKQKFTIAGARDKLKTESTNESTGSGTTDKEIETSGSGSASADTLLAVKHELESILEDLRK